MKGSDEEIKLSSPIIQLSRYLQECAGWIEPEQEMPSWGFNQHLEAITCILEDLVDPAVELEFSGEVLENCQEVLKHCATEIRMLIMPVPGEAPGKAADAVEGLDSLLTHSADSYLDGISALMQMLETRDAKYANLAGEYFTRGALELENAGSLTDELNRRLGFDPINPEGPPPDDGWE